MVGGEGLTLAEAAARVGREDEVTLVVTTWCWDEGRAEAEGAAVDLDDEGVVLGVVVVLGEGEPALDVEAFVLPFDGLEAGARRRWWLCG